MIGYMDWDPFIKSAIRKTIHLLFCYVCIKTKNDLFHKKAICFILKANTIFGGY